MVLTLFFLKTYITTKATIKILYLLATGIELLLELKCKLRLNGTPVPLLRNGYSIFNGTKYR